jgi:biopolymer transport protein ExbB
MNHGWFHVRAAAALLVCLALMSALDAQELEPEAGPPEAAPTAGPETTATSPESSDDKTPPPDPSGQMGGLLELLRTGGIVGGLIFLLSLTMVYLIIEQLLSIRRSSLMPTDLAKSVHRHLTERKLPEAQQQCQTQPCFLSNVLNAGLSVVDFGYQDVEKAMEDTATEQAARLFRKIEYLHLIGTLAPMLGLLGTVWGMITAFMEFESKANPAVSELAPGIYRALVTTMMGLTVAVPAFASFAIFRNRIDELVAEASLTAEHVFVDYRRDEARRKKKAKEKNGDDLARERRG